MARLVLVYENGKQDLSLRAPLAAISADRSSPIVKFVTAGDIILALHEDGTVANISPRSLRNLPFSTQVLDIAAGTQHVLFLVAATSGKDILAVGDNRWGQLGRLTADSTSVPKRAAAVMQAGIDGTREPIRLVAGPRHSGFITRGGRLCIWGGRPRGAPAPSDRIAAATPNTTGRFRRDRMQARASEKNVSYLQTDEWLGGAEVEDKIVHHVGAISEFTQSCFGDAAVRCAAFGSHHAVVCSVAGRVYQWGDLGSTNLAQHRSYSAMSDAAVRYSDGRDSITEGLPNEVHGQLFGARVVEVHAGDCCSVARTADGALYRWGAVPREATLTAQPSSTLGEAPPAVPRSDLSFNWYEDPVLVGVSETWAALQCQQAGAYDWGLDFDPARRPLRSFSSGVIPHPNIARPMGESGGEQGADESTVQGCRVGWGPLGPVAGVTADLKLKASGYASGVYMTSDEPLAAFLDRHWCICAAQSNACLAMYAAPVPFHSLAREGALVDPSAAAIRRLRQHAESCGWQEPQALQQLIARRLIQYGRFADERPALGFLSDQMPAAFWTEGVYNTALESTHGLMPAMASINAGAASLTAGATAGGDESGSFFDSGALGGLKLRHPTIPSQTQSEFVGDWFQRELWRDMIMDFATPAPIPTPPAEQQGATVDSQHSERSQVCVPSLQSVHLHVLLETNDDEQYDLGQQSALAPIATVQVPAATVFVASTVAVQKLAESALQPKYARSCRLRCLAPARTIASEHPSPNTHTTATTVLHEAGEVAVGVAAAVTEAGATSSNGSQGNVDGGNVVSDAVNSPEPEAALAPSWSSYDVPEDSITLTDTATWFYPSPHLDLHLRLCIDWQEECIRQLDRLHTLLPHGAINDSVMLFNSAFGGSERTGSCNGSTGYVATPNEVDGVSQQPNCSEGPAYNEECNSSLRGLAQMSLLALRCWFVMESIPAATSLLKVFFHRLQQCQTQDTHDTSHQGNVRAACVSLGQHCLVLLQHWAMVLDLRPLMDGLEALDGTELELDHIAPRQAPRAGGSAAGSIAGDDDIHELRNAWSAAVHDSTSTPAPSKHMQIAFQSVILEQQLRRRRSQELGALQQHIQRLEPEQRKAVGVIIGRVLDSVDAGAGMQPSDELSSATPSAALGAEPSETCAEALTVALDDEACSTLLTWAPQVAAALRKRQAALTALTESEHEHTPGAGADDPEASTTSGSALESLLQSVSTTVDAKPKRRAVRSTLKLRSRQSSRRQQQQGEGDDSDGPALLELEAEALRRHEADEMTLQARSADPQPGDDTAHKTAASSGMPTPGLASLHGSDADAWVLAKVLGGCRQQRSLAVSSEKDAGSQAACTAPLESSANGPPTKLALLQSSIHRSFSAGSGASAGINVGFSVVMQRASDLGISLLPSKERVPSSPALGHVLNVEEGENPSVGDVHSWLDDQKTYRKVAKTVLRKSFPCDFSCSNSASDAVFGSDTSSQGSAPQVADHGLAPVRNARRGKSSAASLALANRIRLLQGYQSRSTADSGYSTASSTATGASADTPSNLGQQHLHSLAAASHSMLSMRGAYSIVSSASGTSAQSAFSARSQASKNSSRRTKVLMREANRRAAQLDKVQSAFRRMCLTEDWLAAMGGDCTVVVRTPTSRTVGSGSEEHDEGTPQSSSFRVHSWVLQQRAPLLWTQMKAEAEQRQTAAMGGAQLRPAVNASTDVGRSSPGDELTSAVTVNDTHRSLCLTLPTAIADANCAATLLRFLYTGVCAMSIHVVVPLLRVADEFRLPCLRLAVEYAAVQHRLLPDASDDTAADFIADVAHGGSSDPSVNPVFSVPRFTTTCTPFPDASEATAAWFLNHHAQHAALFAACGARLRDAVCRAIVPTARTQASRLSQSTATGDRTARPAATTAPRQQRASGDSAPHDSNASRPQAQAQAPHTPAVGPASATQPPTRSWAAVMNTRLGTDRFGAERAAWERAVAAGTAQLPRLPTGAVDLQRVKEALGTESAAVDAEPVLLQAFYDLMAVRRTSAESAHGDAEGGCGDISPTQQEPEGAVGRDNAATCAPSPTNHVDAANSHARETATEAPACDESMPEGWDSRAQRVPGSASYLHSQCLLGAGALAVAASQHSPEVDGAGEEYSVVREWPSLHAAQSDSTDLPQ